MFAHMVSDLKNGILPETNALRKRFDAALVKKMGVIRTPYSFWPGDTKINPPSKQLLWAAILLQDGENYKVVEAIISTELEEKMRAKGLHENMESLTAKVQQLLQEYLDEFIELTNDRTFKNKLQQLVRDINP
jgi:predicted transcriptional regulator